MTDYSAHDIHRLDQAYPDALADIERFTGNPANKNRLAEVGPEVYAAELTRDLAFYTDNPMSLAGWAAIATVRLMDAGRMWEDDTEMAWAKVDEAKAELDKLRAQVADLADKLHKADAEIASHTKAATAWANENQRLRDRLFADKPVIDAALAWAETVEDDTPGDFLKATDALHDAVESYRVMDMALDAAHAEAGVAR